MRNSSAKSYCTSVMSMEDSDDDDDVETNSDEDNIEDVGSDDEENDERCKFGRGLSKPTLKHLLFEDTCYCDCKNTFDDSVSGWNGFKKSKKSKFVKKRSKSAYSQVPTAYLRLLNSAKENDFKFNHYKDASMYIKQYRINHTVGDVCGEYKEDDTVINEPYDFKLKANISALTQHFDFLEIYSLPIGPPINKNQSEPNDNEKQKVEDEDEDDDDDDDEKLIKMSVKERGKNLNLAPVRASTAIRRSEIKIAKKTLVPFNPYLNLIIPKTTLNQADVQFNIETHRSETPRFEPSRVVFTKAQANFKESTVSKSYERRKMTSPADRANEVRLLRTSTYPPETTYNPVGTNVKSTDTSVTSRETKSNTMRINSASSRKRYILPYTPLVHTLKINQSSNDGDSKPQMISSSLQTEYKPEREKEIKYRFKFLENVQRIPEKIKHDTVVPLSVGAFSLHGKTCMPEDNPISSIQRIRKERQSRTAMTYTTNY